MKEAFLIMLIGASITVYVLCLVWLLYHYFQKDTKHVKKMIGVFILGIMLGWGLAYGYYFQQIHNIYTSGSCTGPGQGGNCVLFD